jgi:hypothetical protein
MKDQKFLSVIGGLVLLTFGLFSGSASAASVDVVADESMPGEVTFSVSGSGFPLPNNTVGGDWNVIFDETILQYVSLTWDAAFFLNSVNDANAANGSLRADGTVLCFGCSPGDPALLPDDFAIATMVFNVLSAAPTILDLQVSLNGWSLSDSSIIPGVTYGSASVGAPVPVPAAAWLFGSALGMLAWVRRRTAA